MRGRWPAATTAVQRWWAATIGRRRRAAIALAAIAVAAAAAGLIAGGGGDGADEAAALAPPGTALWIHVTPDDRLERLGRRFPSLLALRRRLLGTQDTSSWLGDELALAVPAGGGPPLLLAAVTDREAARRFRPPARSTAALAGDFLAIGPDAEVRAAVDRADGGRSLADDTTFQEAAALEDAPVELYAPAAGLRRLLDLPAPLTALAAFADSPAFRALAAGLTPEDQGVRVTARVMRTARAAPAREFAPALAGRVPASAAAYLDLPGAPALISLLERSGAADLVNAVRAALPRLTGVDLDRDLLAPLGTEAGLTLTARGATPVITLTARSSDPTLTSETLARLQDPLARRLAPNGPGVRDAGNGGFTLPITPQLQPSYVVVGDVVVVSTAPDGLAQRTVAQRGVARERVLREVADDTGGRVEALAFADLRQLLALGDRTGLAPGPGLAAVRDDLRQVRALGAVVRREGSDSTVELFLEIP